MQRGLTHALGLESGLMSPVTLAAIAADADAALRGSSTLSSSGAAARPVVRASRWKVWLPLLIAAALAAGVAAWLTRDWWSARRVAGRAGAAGVARRRAVRSGLVGRSRARRRHRRGRHGARPAAARRPRRRRSRPPPRTTASTAEAVLTRHQVDGLVRGTATWNDGLARVRVTVLRAGGGAPAVRAGVRAPGRAGRRAAAARRQRDGARARRPRVERRVVAAVARRRRVAGRLRGLPARPIGDAPPVRGERRRAPSSTSTRRSPSTATTGRRSSAWPSATCCRA